MTRGQVASQASQGRRRVHALFTDNQYSRVNAVAYSEPPPQVENRKAVKENCQGWTSRVLSRLAAEGIVDEDKIVGLQQYMDPIN
jgi:hypothetical protein